MSGQLSLSPAWHHRGAHDREKGVVGIEAEARRALRNVRAVLRAAGAEMEVSGMKRDFKRDLL